MLHFNIKTFLLSLVIALLFQTVISTYPLLAEPIANRDKYLSRSLGRLVNGLFGKVWEGRGDPSFMGLRGVA